jgi:hypothetical protein
MIKKFEDKREYEDRICRAIRKIQDAIINNGDILNPIRELKAELTPEDALAVEVAADTNDINEFINSAMGKIKIINPDEKRQKETEIAALYINSIVNRMYDRGVFTLNFSPAFREELKKIQAEIQEELKKQKGK